MENPRSSVVFGIHCQGSKRVPKLNLTQGLKKTAGGGGGGGRVAVMVIIPVVLNHPPSHLRMDQTLELEPAHPVLHSDSGSLPSSLKYQERREKI